MPIPETQVQHYSIKLVDHDITGFEKPARYSLKRAVLPVSKALVLKGNSEVNRLCVVEDAVVSGTREDNRLSVAEGPVTKGKSDVNRLALTVMQ